MCIGSGVSLVFRLDPSLNWDRLGTGDILWQMVFVVWEVGTDFLDFRQWTTRGHPHRSQGSTVGLDEDVSQDPEVTHDGSRTDSHLGPRDVKRRNTSRTTDLCVSSRLCSDPPQEGRGAW